MIALPFAIASSLLILISIIIGERTLVIFSAAVLFILGLSATLLLLRRSKSLSAVKLNFLLTLSCLLIFLSVPMTNWPLRVAFKFSRQSFDRIANQLQVGRTYPEPIHIGLFSIKKAEVYKLNGKVCLWTDMDPAGKTGFTKCPINNVPFNLWSIIQLDENWQFIAED